MYLQMNSCPLGFNKHGICCVCLHENSWTERHNIMTRQVPCMRLNKNTHATTTHKHIYWVFIVDRNYHRSIFRVSVWLKYFLSRLFNRVFETPHDNWLFISRYNGLVISQAIIVYLILLQVVFIWNILEVIWVFCICITWIFQSHYNY